MDSLKAKKFRQNPDLAMKEMKLTRRELLELGVLPFAVRLMVPSVVQLMSNLITADARAQTLSSTIPIPFININLSGGASLDANVIPYNNVNGVKSLLPNYQLLGMGNTTGTDGVEANIVPYLGTHFHKNSPMLKGLVEILGENPDQNIKLTSLCVETASDTFNVISLRPPFDVSHAVEAAGRKGTYLSDLHVSNSGSFYGTMSISPFRSEEPESRTQVQTLNEILKAVSLSGFITEQNKIQSNSYNNLNKNQQNGLVKLIRNLANVQIGDQKKELNKAYADAENLLGGAVSGVDLVDPYKNSDAISAFSLTKDSSQFDQAFAGSVHATIQGYTSHCMILFGGYDYHQPTLRVDSDKKDYAFGKKLGQILKYATLTKKPVFITVTTDGSNRVSFDNKEQSTTSIWDGDSRSSLQLMVAYQPEGIIQTDNQVGSYLMSGSNGITDAKTLVGNRGDYVSAAILANYLSVSGLLDLNKKDFSLYTKISPSTITTDRLSEVVKLFKKVG